jgi:FMN phosphatase YigB (HAD superfamily)
MNKQEFPSDSCDAASNKNTPPFRRIVLFDLDLTLFDYSAVRKETTEQVIYSLRHDIPFSKKLSIYEWILQHSEGFRLIGFPDFRQLWNNPKFYIAVLVLSEMSGDSFSALGNEIKEIEHGNIPHKKGNNYSTESAISHFLSRVKQIESDTKSMLPIDEAVRKFNILTRKIPLSKNAENLIMSLVEVGIESYVVTEGKKPIQTEKFKKLGLQRLIESRNFLVVDKKNRHSFLDVLKAIQIFPDYPQKFLEGLVDLDYSQISNRKLLKVASVGDRYDKDIAPLLEILGKNVITIRLLFGKYKNKFATKYLKREKLILPIKTTSSLREVLKFLTDDDVWTKVEALDPFQLEVKD